MCVCVCVAQQVVKHSAQPVISSHTHHQRLRASLTFTHTHTHTHTTHHTHHTHLSLAHTTTHSLHTSQITHTRIYIHTYHYHTPHTQFAHTTALHNTNTHTYTHIYTSQSHNVHVGGHLLSRHSFRENGFKDRQHLLHGWPLRRAVAPALLREPFDFWGHVAWNERPFAIQDLQRYLHEVHPTKRFTSCYHLLFFCLFPKEKKRKKTRIMLINKRDQTLTACRK